MATSYKNLSDTEDEIVKVPTLDPWLRQWREETDPVYGNARTDLYKAFDQEAVELQRRHRRIVTVAAVCGGLAVILAIAQLALWAREDSISREWWNERAWWVEGVFALLAFYAVVQGLRASVAKDWVLKRFKAERIRHLKFEALSRSLHTAQTPDDNLAYIREELKLMETADYKTAVALMKQRLQAVEPVKPYAGLPDRQMIDNLTTFAIDTYLKPQEDYFELQAKKREGWDRWTHRFAPYCFFVSVVCALVHFGYDTAEHFATLLGYEQTPHSHLSDFSVALLFVAAAAPVIGAVVRTIRSAHEFGRNANRFNAVKCQLITIQQRLADDKLGLDERLMWFVRGVWLLETEQLAWMRLMHEAEWFG